MPKSLVYSWLTTCTGVELVLDAEAIVQWRTVQVTVNGEQLTIGTKRQAEGTLPEILKKAQVGGPVAVSLNGKGILTRKISATESAVEETFRSTFPSLDPADFYMQQFHATAATYLSIVRKSLADELIQQLETAGMTVLLLSLGPFPVAHVLKQFNTYGGKFVFDGHEVAYAQDGGWDDYHFEAGKRAAFPVKIGQETLDEQLIVAYATAFQLALYKRLPVLAANVPALEDQLDDLEQRKRFNRRFGGVVGTTFVVLLINFCLFSWLLAGNDQLQQRVSVTSAKVQNVEVLKQDAGRKQLLLGKLGWKNRLPLAYLAQQTGSSVPSGLILKGMHIHAPSTADTSSADAQIMVKGASTGTDPVNTWMYRLKQQSWVKQVRLDRYSARDADGRSEFQLNITY